MPRPSPPWFLADIFGLYLPSLLEPEDSRRERIATVQKKVAETFAAAKRHLGEDEAIALFHHVAKRPNRGKGKTLAPNRDDELLQIYDGRARGESVAAIARRVYAATKNERGASPFGATARAIETQIRKLDGERKARQKKARFEGRRMRMAMRNRAALALGFGPGDHVGR